MFWTVVVKCSTMRNQTMTNTLKSAGYGVELEMMKSVGHVVSFFFFAFNITFKHIGHGEAVTQHLLCCISCNLGQVYKYLCSWWYFTGNSPAVFSALSQREKICCFFVCILYRAFSCSCAKGCGWCLLEPKAKTVPFIHVLAFFLYASSMIKQEMLFTAVQ